MHTGEWYKDKEGVSDNQKRVFCPGSEVCSRKSLRLPTVQRRFLKLNVAFQSIPVQGEARSMQLLCHEKRMNSPLLLNVRFGNREDNEISGCLPLERHRKTSEQETCSWAIEDQSFQVWFGQRQNTHLTEIVCLRTNRRPLFLFQPTKSVLQTTGRTEEENVQFIWKRFCLKWRQRHHLVRFRLMQQEECFLLMRSHVSVSSFWSNRNISHFYFDTISVEKDSMFLLVDSKRQQKCKIHLRQMKPRTPTITATISNTGRGT